MRSTLKLIVLLPLGLSILFSNSLYAQSVSPGASQFAGTTSGQTAILEVLESAVEDLGFLLTLHDNLSENAGLVRQLKEDYLPLFDQSLIAKLVLKSNFTSERQDHQNHLACLVNLAFFNNHLKFVATIQSQRKQFDITSTESSTGNTNVASVQLTLDQGGQPANITYHVYYRKRDSKWRIWDVRTGSSSLIIMIRNHLRKIHSTSTALDADAYIRATELLKRQSAKDLISADRWCNPIAELPIPDTTDLPEESASYNSFEVKTTINGQSHTVYLEVDSNDTVLYQDDIILDTDGDLKAALRGLDFRHLRLWTGATVPYIIDASIADKALVMRAIEEWQNHTPVRFIKARDTDANFVVFTAGEGCRASLGMKRRGRQNIVLSRKCSYGAILHEIGHTLGLIHEHNRDDRDNFVAVKLKNVQHKKEHNFRKHPPGFPVSDAYCYSSIMHYSEHAFAKSRKLKTIDVKGRNKIGQRKRLSGCDINRIRSLYAPLATASESDNKTKP